MKALLTVYVHPDKRSDAVNSLKPTVGDDIVFYSDRSQLLSWIGEKTIHVADQNAAFELERELQKIPELADVEIMVDDAVQEDELNLRYAQLNETINEGKTLFPHPAWYQHAIKINEALEFAQTEFRAGRGSFDASSTRLDMALIDTGYSAHPEIDGVDKRQGKNFMPGENENDPLDLLESTRPLPIAWGGHGTSCSGVLVGQKATIPPEHKIERKNVFYDDLIEGILPNNLNVIHFRVSRNIISFNSRMPRAIDHISGENKIRVISMSHATLFNRKSVYAATRTAYEKGIIFVAAPGSHVFASKKVFTYPAKYKETIAAAASTSLNLPWRLTHGGPEVDLCAPGFEIYIPWPFKNKEKQVGYAYKWSEGSSFAVPIVACAASLWRMHHGDRLNQFSPVEQIELFRKIIKKTATPFAGPVDAGLYGSGVINLLEMLQHPLILAQGTASKALSMPLTPQALFSTNKREASLKRELAYLKANQFVSNQAKAMPEMDFYYTSGTAAFNEWINKKTRNKADKPAVLDSILEKSAENY